MYYSCWLEHLNREVLCEYYDAEKWWSHTVDVGVYGHTLHFNGSDETLAEYNKATEKRTHLAWVVGEIAMALAQIETEDMDEVIAKAKVIAARKRPMYHLTD